MWQLVFCFSLCAKKEWMKRVDDTTATALYSSASSRMLSVDAPSPSNSTSAEGEKSLRTHSPVGVPDFYFIFWNVWFIYWSLLSPLHSIGGFVVQLDFFPIYFHPLFVVQGLGGSAHSSWRATLWHGRKSKCRNRVWCLLPAEFICEVRFFWFLVPKGFHSSVLWKTIFSFISWHVSEVFTTSFPPPKRPPVWCP